MELVGTEKETEQERLEKEMGKKTGEKELRQDQIKEENGRIVTEEEEGQKGESRPQAQEGRGRALARLACAFEGVRPDNPELPLLHQDKPEVAHPDLRGRRA